MLTHPSYVSSSYVKENKELKNKKDLTVDSEKNPKDLLKKIVDKLIEINFITDTLANGNTKFMVLEKIKILFKLENKF